MLSRPKRVISMIPLMTTSKLKKLLIRSKKILFCELIFLEGHENIDLQKTSSEKPEMFQSGIGFAMIKIRHIDKKSR
jgi:hypothetical protein